METKPQFILKRVKGRASQINSRVTRPSKTLPARIQQEEHSKQELHGS